MTRENTDLIMELQIQAHPDPRNTASGAGEESGRPLLAEPDSGFVSVCETHPADPPCPLSESAAARCDSYKIGLDKC
jgi:hypothetical protein